MPHTDDGTLHAHLDGELTPPEAAELQSHLATCAACRERLDAARGVRDRAHTILRRADPPPVSMPDFATLRARRTSASAPQPTPRPQRASRGLVLAWAASVAVALGAGWFAQELLRGGGNETVAISAYDTQIGEAAPEAMSAPPEAATQPSVGAAQSAEGGTPLRADAPPAARTFNAEVATAADAAATEDADLPAAAVAKDNVEPQQPAIAIAARAAADASEQASGFAAPPPPAALRGLPAAAADLGDSGAGGWPGSDGWVAVDAEEAAARLGATLRGIPDLTIIGHAVAADGSPVARLTQRLPGGEEAEVLQRHNAATGEMEIIVRAPVAADSLERLRRDIR